MSAFIAPFIPKTSRANLLQQKRYKAGLFTSFSKHLNILLGKNV